jgi:predicted enzyme related to lactoylglutathione lyase
MTMASDSGFGSFGWYELMTSDPQAAEGFYTQLIGWTTQPWEGGDRPYTVWALDANPLGGLMELPDEVKQAGAPPHWIGYVMVESADATAGRVRELGGEVLHPPTEIPGAGRFSVIRDPQGAVLAIYESAEQMSDEECTPGVGRFSWHELVTSDHEAAYTFYAELFGWEKMDAMDMGPGGIYQLYGRRGAHLGGMFNKPAEMPGPPMWLYYISVQDVNSAVDKVKELGGQVVNGPMEVPGGDLIAQCLDPQGALFALHSSPRQTS